MSGRYPNLGPSILADAGIPIVDRVGPLALRKIPDGSSVRIQGDRVFVGDRLVAVGRALVAVLEDLALTLLGVGADDRARGRAARGRRDLGDADLLRGVGAGEDLAI